MNLDTTHFKNLLEAEQKRLEHELLHIAKRSSNTDIGWDTVQSEVGQDTADRSEVAENLDTYTANESVVAILETELHEVKNALQKIELGTYGFCEANGHPIEPARLEANPSARTCIEHMNKGQ